MYNSTYDDVCELLLCLPARSTCANILVANYFYKLPLPRANTVSHSFAYVDTSSDRNKHTCFNFQLFFMTFIYVCGVILRPLFTFHRSLIFHLITYSTLNTTTSLPNVSYSNSRRTRFPSYAKVHENILKNRVRDS